MHLSRKLLCVTRGGGFFSGFVVHPPPQSMDKQIFQIYRFSMHTKISLLFILVALSAQANSLPKHWVCGPFKANTGNPIMRVEYLPQTDELQLTLEEDWTKEYGSLPKGKYTTPSHPSSSGASRYVHMDVTRYFPYPHKPEIPAYLSFSLSYTASAFISEIYILYADPENPYVANTLAEYLCEAY